MIHVIRSKASQRLIEEMLVTLESYIKLSGICREAWKLRDSKLIRERYLRDALSVRLGGLAADLARVSTFSKNPRNREAVSGLLEESKHFIEWTAGDAGIDIAAELVELQVQLALWQQRWATIWLDDAQRSEVAAQARDWSDRVLRFSGLLA